ncbi:MAG: hypothetical protein HN353_07255 [Bdellovibrionales bacterium]|nr:hypothetical protein [Bdellovibrionales bacterium]MBT3526607.1 hypothetical protein [Bdellovibrionales bacterium]MBT7668044.1 hypothetical protein [Bdellovibrionales bacterium]MBT7766735.1 hypothetical protein [Bdellovibrionales bacterium]
MYVKSLYACFIYLLLLLATPNSYASLDLEPFVAFGLGGGDFNQWDSPRPIDHDAYILAPEIGTRLGVDIFRTILGGVISIGRYHIESARTDDNPHAIGGDSYGNGVVQRLMGAYGGFALPVGLKVWGEIYSQVSWDFHYAEPKLANPFSKDDRLEGEGFAVGVGYRDLGFSFELVYRQLVFDLLTTSAGVQAFPNGFYSKFTTYQLMGQLAFTIGLL